ncbi:YceD family protein [Hydrogenophaga sp. 2FB]|uniref:YceD family protein n=1 Tax=Hydrogenophaga sp. 2FB TaxID=2502187 RepID=UPI0010F502E1|nr:YceD family protein [Hydrogenophaga sp. 2FB]
MSLPSKTNPKTAWNPDRLDVRAFALAGARLEAEVPLPAFERLYAEAAPADGAPASVHWQAQGEMRPAASGGAPAVWLHLEADTHVPLTCQRCLGVVDTGLTVDRWFRFVADEAAAAAEDDDCEEDLLALEPRPRLHDVLEDELLMELPLVPMHEVCPVQVPMQATDPEVDAGDTEVRKNPFAALARLKK